MQPAQLLVLVAILGGCGAAVGDGSNTDDRQPAVDGGFREEADAADVEAVCPAEPCSMIEQCGWTVKFWVRALPEYVNFALSGFA